MLPFTTSATFGYQRLTLSVPRAGSPLDQRLCVQCAVFDLPANPAGLTTSAGLELRIGNR